MQIIGTGMVARSLQPYAQEFPDVIAFASGVANSLQVNDNAYKREYTLLNNTLEVCRRDGMCLLYFSSAGAIYGPTSEIRDEYTPTQPITHYGKHKLLCESIIRMSDSRYIIFRLANLVGAMQNSAQLLPSLIQQIKCGNVKLQRNATRDILDVNDFASILAKLLKVVPDYEVIVLASGISVRVDELVRAIQDVLEVNSTVQYINGGEQQRFSISKLCGLLPDISFNKNYYRTVVQKYAETNARNTLPK